MMKETVYTARTKLLLSGEYLVTRGALALALPLRFTQELRITDTGKPGTELLWQSRELGKIWFEGTFDKEDFQINATTDKQIATSLQRILLATRELNPDFLNGSQEIHAETDTDFELKWGLGSSSTLIASVAQWAGVNPYRLLQKTFGGSGYDIACAMAHGSIFYQLTDNNPIIQAANFAPSFSSLIGFVYLGKKMNSRDSLEKFKTLNNYSALTLEQISNISKELTQCDTIECFEKLLNEHENIMANVLQTEPIKKQLFADYPFTVKSLGAWGGDFALFTCRNPKEAITYFQQKNMKPIFGFDDIVLI